MFGNQKNSPLEINFQAKNRDIEAGKHHVASARIYVLYYNPSALGGWVLNQAVLSQ